MRKWILAVFTLLAGNVFASDNTFVFVSDSVAGEMNHARISGLIADEIVQFELSRPDGTLVTLNEKADELGSLGFYINGIHLQKTGGYALEVRRSYFPTSGLVSNFQVYPGEVSAYRTKIDVARSSLPADGKAISEFTIRLQDAYGNPVPHQTVKVFSSRNSDIVVAEKSSNAEGLIYGKIKSDDPGVSVLSVLAGDTVIFQRPELVFYLHDAEMPNIGSSGKTGFGQFLKAQLFAEEFGEVAYFSVEELPSSIIQDEVTSVRIEAKDENGEIVRNYLGKVRFSSSDNEARLPADYQFDSEDQGFHVFSLAVAFGTPGKHTLAVHDLNDFRINGEKPITVLRADGGVDLSGEKGIQIESPEPGSYNLSRVTIKGKAFGTQMVKIIDGPTLLVESLPVDQDTGDFMFQTPTLADGAHKFQVISMDESLKSEELFIRIDRMPPTVMAVELIPDEEMKPSQDFQIKVASSEPLSASNCTFDTTKVELNNAGDYFLIDTLAPPKCGKYPMTCTIADLLGNEFTEPRAAMVRVCSTGFDTDEDGILDEEEPGDDDGDCVENKYESIIIDSDGNGLVDQLDPANDSDDGGVSNEVECKEDETDPLDPLDDNISEVPPTAVTNLSAEPGEKRVTLFWSPAKDDTEIWKYRIEFGKDPEALDQENQTPDNRTQWYVDELEKGQKYFFRVFAIDVDGFEGPPSRTVEATTLGAHLAAEKLEKVGSGGLVVSLMVLVMAMLMGTGFLIMRRQ